MKRLFFYLFLLLLSYASSIQAQDLSLDSVTSGNLASGESMTYSFIAREGQILSFLVRADTNLDPIIRIENTNGTVLVSNDDYQYPQSRNALIEGFYAPYNGSYTLVLSGFGASAGAYELSMISGYSQYEYSTSFDEGDSWAALTIPENEAATFAVVNGTANLNQTGIQQTGIAVGFSPSSSVYYLSSRFESITGRQGWQVGLVFGLQDAQNYYRVLINQNGAWQLAKVEAGQVTALRDWNTHPAIRAGATSFSLAVLVNGSGYDVFYDESFVGSVVDASFNAGQVGITVVTANAVGGDVTARYTSMLVTSPLYVNEQPVFPTQLVGAGMNGTIRELERRLLIPTGGTLAFTIPESFAQNNRAGVSAFPMGNQASYESFVLGVTVTWAASGADLNACGIVLHDDGANNYALAYVDSEGGYGLSERVDTAFIQNKYNNRILLQRPPYQLLLIANGEIIDFFINGQHAQSISISRSSGMVAEAVVNFEAVNTNCQFNNFWLWTW